MIEVWIEDWRNGDQHAAELIYQHFAAEIYRLTIGILGNRQDAEEVSQDAFVYAFCHIQDFDSNLASFRTWLHLIAVSRSRDRLRKHNLDQVSLHALLERGIQFKTPKPQPEDQALLNELENEFLQLLQRLSPKLREALVLRFWAEHTYKEMALIMGCPIPTAQSRVRVAITKLQELRVEDLQRLKDVRELSLK